MHNFDIQVGVDKASPQDNRPWYRTLTRYHWFVLTVAILGWMLDCLDQQLFVLARPEAMRELVADPTMQTSRGNLATTIFMVGWGAGGLLFGVLGDRIGRAKTMLFTILLYSLFTGLSAVSQGFWDFALYRFLTGLGVGGEFAVGVALIAEVMPPQARTHCLALLQAFTALGNVTAAMINLGLGIAHEADPFATSPWRIMFVIGALPALLALVIRARLKEPEAWVKSSHDEALKRQLGSYTELFRSPTLRRHAIFGLILGSSGIIGLWSIAFFTPDLMRKVQRPRVARAVYDEQFALAKEDSKLLEKLTRLRDIKLAKAREVPGFKLDDDLKETSAKVERTISARLDRWSSYTSMMINIGGGLGMFGFGALSQRIGRKPVFALAFLAAFFSSASVILFINELWQIFVFVPIMGFCQLSVFAGYAIYFPELFPTHLRSTGTSFCYNVGRFVAALGPLVKSMLEWVFQYSESPSRYASVAMCGVFLVGLLVLPFLPETRGKPLPE